MQHNFKNTTEEIRKETQIRFYKAMANAHTIVYFRMLAIEVGELTDLEDSRNEVLSDGIKGVQDWIEFVTMICGLR